MPLQVYCHTSPTRKHIWKWCMISFLTNFFRLSFIDIANFISLSLLFRKMSKPFLKRIYWGYRIEKSHLERIELKNVKSWNYICFEEQRYRSSFTTKSRVLNLHNIQKKHISKIMDYYDMDQPYDDIPDYDIYEPTATEIWTTCAWPSIQHIFKYFLPFLFWNVAFRITSQASKWILWIFPTKTWMNLFLEKIIILNLQSTFHSHIGTFLR